MSSFERLSLADRRQMTSLLPNVDSDPNGRYNNDNNNILCIITLIV